MEMEGDGEDCPPPPQKIEMDEDGDSESSSIELTEPDREEVIPPEYVTNFSQFEMFRRNNVLTDVTFRGTHSSPVQDLRAHKVILAVSTPYFDQLFKDGNEIYEFPFTTEALEYIITFMYTGQIPRFTEDNLEQLLMLSDVCQLSKLFDRCKLMLKCILNISNFNRFESLIRRFLSGDDTLMQLITRDFQSYSLSPMFLHLNFNKVEEIVKFRDPTGCVVPSALMLQAVLKWVQAEIHTRQKHLLGLMQFIKLEDVPAEMMKSCMITLNTCYRNPQAAVEVEHLSEPEPMGEDPSPEEESAEQSDKDLVKEKKKRPGRRRKPIPGDSSSISDLFEPDKPIQVPIVNEKLANQLKILIRKTDPAIGSRKKESPTKNLETIEPTKKRTHESSNPDNSGSELTKKPRISRSEDSRPEKHSAERGVHYISGDSVPKISIKNPLMFYIRPNSNEGKDIMVYDFLSKETGVLIENACIDYPRTQMAVVNRRLYVIGGRSEGVDPQGYQNHNCLQTVLYYSDFPKVTETGQLRKIKWIADKPIYARDSLLESRSNCGVTVWRNTIFTLGGRGTGKSIIRSLNSGEKLQCVNGSGGWTKIKAMSKHREDFGVGVVDDSVFVIGGWISCTSTSCALASVERYQPELDQWQISAPLLQRRCGIRVATLNSCLYAIGGSEKAEVPGKLANMEFYDPRVKYWMQVKNRPAKPFTNPEGAVTTLDGRIISIENDMDDINGRPVIEVFDPRARRWYTEGTLPTNGYFSSACFMNMT